MYDSSKYYLIMWRDDYEMAVTDGWNVQAIKHQDSKEGGCSISVLREATQEDIDKYGVS